MPPYKNTVLILYGNVAYATTVFNKLTRPTILPEDKQRIEAVEKRKEYSEKSVLSRIHHPEDRSRLLPSSKHEKQVGTTVPYPRRVTKDILSSHGKASVMIRKSLNRSPICRLSKHEKVSIERMQRAEKRRILRFGQLKFYVSTHYKNTQKQSIFTVDIALAHLRATPGKPFIK